MRALALYRNQPLSVRLHTQIRAATAPLLAIVDRCPEGGTVLDVGCGHGLIANEIALRHEDSDVLGVDIDETKITSAGRTVGERKNVRFATMTIADAPDRGFDALVVADVLYLVPAQEWDSFLATCRKKLRDGGLLFLKEVTTAPAWKFWRLRLQEWMSVHALGITAGEVFHFEPPESLVTRLERAGFHDVRVSRLDRGYATPHVLFEAHAK